MPVLVGELFNLTREDLAQLPNRFVPTVSVEDLKDSHRRIARLLAQGLRTKEVAELTGYSVNRVSLLRNSPAMLDLIEHYRGMVDGAFAKDQDVYYTLAKENMLKAERQIGDALDTADALGKPIDPKLLVAISRDAADRFGYGKKSLQVRANFDFASKMRDARERSKQAARELEHEN